MDKNVLYQDAESDRSFALLKDLEVSETVGIYANHWQRKGDLVNDYAKGFIKRWSDWC